jgi:hypothetical protein
LSSPRETEADVRIAGSLVIRVDGSESKEVAAWLS